MIPSRRLTPTEVDAQPADLAPMLKAHAPQRTLLRGSVACGAGNRAGDVDLSIVKETDKPFSQRISQVIGLCNTPMTVEPLVDTPAASAPLLAVGKSFLTEALRHGKHYDKGTR